MDARSLPQTISRLYFHLSRRRRRQLFGLLVLMMIGACAELVTISAVLPFLALMTEPDKAMDYPLVRHVFGALGWHDEQRLLLPATMLFISVAVFSASVRILLIWVTNKIGYGIGYDLGREVYRRSLFQPYRYHVSHNTSETIAGIGKVQIVVECMLVPLMNVIVATMTAFAILVALIAIDPVVAIGGGAGFTTLYLLITLVTRRNLSKNSQIIAAAQTTRVQAVQEGLGGIRDVLIDGSQELYVRRFNSIGNGLRRAQIINNFIGNAPRYIIEAVGILLLATFAYWLSQREGGLIATIPILGALAVGAQKLLPLMQQIYNGWAIVVGYQRVVDDVVHLLEQEIPPEYFTPNIGRALPFEKSIRLQNVYFRYAPQGRDVLRNLSLEIMKGNHVGFIGKTGSGKSTSLDLVMGLLEPTEGSVLIDGAELSALNRRNWQARIAHVPQTIYLSDASIAENIAFGSEHNDVDMARVQAAARKAQIDAYIGSLPEGYETQVGERGVRLSGGQRQRIGIARALYKQADVLVFDEATSALDDGTERSVMESLRGLGSKVTVLMIAHRLSTLSECDCVFELDSGRLLRQGTYQQIVLTESTTT
ncbi:MAG TPA: ABC transporter ATP-binding protein [Candidimonas sp.]|nr:ABC transporter ATP-binding protein [Candidimonas sp.]